MKPSLRTKTAKCTTSDHVSIRYTRSTQHDYVANPVLASLVAISHMLMIRWFKPTAVSTLPKSFAIAVHNHVYTQWRSRCMEICLCYYCRAKQIDNPTLSRNVSK